MWFFEFSWQMGVIFLLVLANGFFVASEFALVKIRATQLKPLARQGSWRAKLVLKILGKLDAYLSMTQLGITLTSLGLGSAGEPFVSVWIERFFGWIGLVHAFDVRYLAIAVGFGFISFLHIVLGELGPKWIAIRHPRTTTMWTSPLLAVLYYIFLPGIWILNNSANLILGFIGIPPASENDHGYSHEELGDLLMHAGHTHSGDLTVNRILVKALQLKETTAEQIMIKRDAVVALWQDKPLMDNLTIAQKSGYSRMPVCGESLDNVVGVVLVKELLWQFQALGGQANLKSIMRAPLTFFPQTKLPVMLELFRRSRNHMAVVVDRDDRMIGIVSFEDVLEELVGDIRDEMDIEKGPYFDKTDHSVLVDAKIPIRDVALEMTWNQILPTQTTETVEQWCQQHWGFHAPIGRNFDFQDIRVTADDVTPRGVRRVRFEKIIPKVEEA
ncbi:MAG: hemolysin family protein [Verrucomicrobiota bacterium]